MPTKAEHRASIRSMIIHAALDLSGFEWQTEDDALLDTVDRWLNAKKGDSFASAVEKALVEETEEDPNWSTATGAPPMAEG
jgi:hypothetical protein